VLLLFIYLFIYFLFCACFSPPGVWQSRMSALLQRFTDERFHSHSSSTQQQQEQQQQ
jgi:hypothetical protein